MFSIIADAMMTATRTRKSRTWDAPDHWRASEGHISPSNRSHYSEDQRLMRWYEVTGPR